jgi:acetylornithine/N-succinyldiaminopimelate aminotransferase
MFNQLIVPSYAPAPFIPVRGEGSRVWAAGPDVHRLRQRRRGHLARSLPLAMVRALTEQARTLWHVSN